MTTTSTPGHRPATLVVLRHGQTIWNANDRWQGWQDSPLTDLGREQAEQCGLLVAGAGWATGLVAAYSSSSPRAIDTARIALAAANREDLLPPTELDDLRERNYGGFEGLNSEEIDARYPNTRFDAARGDTRLGWKPAGDDAEDLYQVQARVTHAVARLAAAHPGQSVLVVTHSNVVRILDSLSSGYSLEDIWDRTPPNACLFVLNAWANPRLEVVRHFAEAT